jgi:membrane protein YqaA with SNARE-associated domain
MAEFALFVSAFLAATILPFSSEVAFVAALKSGMPFSYAMIAASSGNILAIIFNYMLGYFLFEMSREKLFHSKIGKHAFMLGHKYGYFALLFSWLPIIGDPLTIVAGVVRLKFIWFIIIAGTLRIGRYWLLGFL